MDLVSLINIWSHSVHSIQQILDHSQAKFPIFQQIYEYKRAEMCKRFDPDTLFELYTLIEGKVEYDQEAINALKGKSVLIEDDTRTGATQIIDSVVINVHRISDYTQPLGWWADYECVLTISGGEFILSPTDICLFMQGFKLLSNGQVIELIEQQIDYDTYGISKEANRSPSILFHGHI